MIASRIVPLAYRDESVLAGGPLPAGFLCCAQSSTERRITARAAVQLLAVESWEVIRVDEGGVAAALRGPGQAEQPRHDVRCAVQVPDDDPSGKELSARNGKTRIPACQRVCVNEGRGEEQKSKDEAETLHGESPLRPDRIESSTISPRRGSTGRGSMLGGFFSSSARTRAIARRCPAFGFGGGRVAVDGGIPTSPASSPAAAPSMTESAGVSRGADKACRSIGTRRERDHDTAAPRANAARIGTKRTSTRRLCRRPPGRGKQILSGGRRIFGQP